MATDQLDLFSAIDRENKHVALWTPREIWLRLSQNLIGILKEDKRIECKSARKIHINEVAEYYSMFSNSIDGGVMVFGVENDGRISGCAKMSQDQLNVLYALHVQRCPLDTPEHKKVPVKVSGEDDFVIAVYIPYRGRLVETNKAALSSGMEKASTACQLKKNKIFDPPGTNDPLSLWMRHWRTPQILTSTS